MPDETTHDHGRSGEPKVTIVDDPETRAVMETARKARVEVDSWPAWKRGEAHVEPVKLLDVPFTPNETLMKEAINSMGRNPLDVQSERDRICGIIESARKKLCGGCHLCDGHDPATDPHRVMDWVLGALLDDTEPTVADHGSCKCETSLEVGLAKINDTLGTIRARLDNIEAGGRSVATKECDRLRSELAMAMEAHKAVSDENKSLIAENELRMFSMGCPAEACREVKTEAFKKWLMENGWTLVLSTPTHGDFRFIGGTARISVYNTVREDDVHIAAHLRGIEKTTLIYDLLVASDQLDG